MRGKKGKGALKTKPGLIGSHRLRRIGLPPGILLPPEEGQVKPLSLFCYNEEGFHEQSFDSLPDLTVIRPPGMTAWLNIESVADVPLLERIGSLFSIHPLILEDIQNTEQRPKIEEFENYIYFSFKMLRWNEEQSTIDSEQVSLLLGDGYVISFQEKPGDVFDSIRDRIRSGKGKLRKEGADFLAYAILDSVVDHYFLILETLDIRFDAMEELIIEKEQEKFLREIHTQRRELITLKRSIWPLRDMLNALRKAEYVGITKGVKIFFKDIYDHVIQAEEMTDIFREMIASLLEYNSSEVNNTMSNVMRVLTMISTIFIPLTFIVGVYGMNFLWMPELQWKYGYPLVLGVMGVVVIFMLLFFKRKKWL